MRPKGIAMSLALALLLPDESADRLVALSQASGQDNLEIISNALRLYEAAVFKKDGELVCLKDGEIIPIFDPA